MALELQFVLVCVSDQSTSWEEWTESTGILLLLPLEQQPVPSSLTQHWNSQTHHGYQVSRSTGFPNIR